MASLKRGTYSVSILRYLGGGNPRIVGFPWFAPAREGNGVMGGSYWGIPRRGIGLVLGNRPWRKIVYGFLFLYIRRNPNAKTEGDDA